MPRAKPGPASQAGVARAASRARAQPKGSRAGDPEAPKPVKAFVLIQALPGRVTSVVGALERIQPVREVDTVTGPYDIIVCLEVDELDDISTVVAGKIGGLRGVTRTTTLLCV